MFGMVLVALSIGFNTVRWPIVERMVGPVAEPAPAATRRTNHAAAGSATGKSGINATADRR